MVSKRIFIIKLTLSHIYQFLYITKLKNKIFNPKNRQFFMVYWSKKKVIFWQKIFLNFLDQKCRFLAFFLHFFKISASFFVMLINPNLDWRFWSLLLEAYFATFGGATPYLGWDYHYLFLLFLSFRFFQTSTFSSSSPPILASRGAPNRLLRCKCWWCHPPI